MLSLARAAWPTLRRFDRDPHQRKQDPESNKCSVDLLLFQTNTGMPVHMHWQRLRPQCQCAVSIPWNGGCEMGDALSPESTHGCLHPCVFAAWRLSTSFCTRPLNVNLGGLSAANIDDAQISFSLLCFDLGQMPTKQGRICQRFPRGTGMSSSQDLLADSTIVQWLVHSVQHLDVCNIVLCPSLHTQTSGMCRPDDVSINTLGLKACSHAYIA